MERSDMEIIEMLNEAKYEILNLRRRNERLSSQMAIVEIFAAALGLKPEDRGATRDIAWELEKKAEELDRKIRQANDGGQSVAENRNE